MIGGLLDYLKDPEKMAEIEQNNANRKYIIGRLAEQTGMPREEASAALWIFECTATSDGETLN